MKLYRNNLAEIGTPTAGTTTSSSIVVTGTVSFFKDGTWGVAYKKHSGSSWTHVASGSQNIETTLTGLDADTKYDIKLYVLFGGEYQYGTAIEKTTSEAPAESPAE